MGIDLNELDKLESQNKEEPAKKKDLGKGFSDELFSSKEEDKPSRKTRAKKPQKGKTFYLREDIIDAIAKLSYERDVSDSVIATEIFKDYFERNEINYEK